MVVFEDVDGLWQLSVEEDALWQLSVEADANVNDAVAATIGAAVVLII